MKRAILFVLMVSSILVLAGCSERQAQATVPEVEFTMCDEQQCPSFKVENTDDNQAVTIEVANSSTGGNWPVSDTAYNAMIDLVVDICWRNGISSLTWTGDSSGTLTIHKFFAATVCPGPYLEARMPNIADAVNSRLSACAAIKSDVEAAINTLKQQGIIDATSYWAESFAAINFLGDLLISMADAPKNTTPVSVPNINSAITRLASKGVINSPDYWSSNCNRILYLSDLIIKVAKRLA